MTGDTLGQVHLSVIIPAYNEERRIGSTLERIIQYLSQKPWSWEILVVIDGSRDSTAEVVRTAGAGAGPEQLRILDNDVNRGKGFCVRRGMLESRGAFRLFSDADLSTPIEEVDRLLEALEAGHDVAIASRGLPESDVRVRQAKWRQSMGRVFNWFVQRLAVPGIQDTQCGFKLFTADAARRLFTRQRIEQFGFDVEILWNARKLDYRIAELPVVWINDPQSKVNPITDSTRMLVDLLRIRYWDHKGRYGQPGLTPGRIRPTAPTSLEHDLGLDVPRASTPTRKI